MYDKNKQLKLISADENQAIKYTKQKKKNYYSIYDKVFEKYKNEISNYENSFVIPKNGPVLYLTNSTNDLYNYIYNNNDNYTQLYARDTKDAYSDMNKIEIVKNDIELEKLHVKNIEYKGPLNRTYFTSEYLMLNDIFGHIFTKSSKDKRKTKKKYKLLEVNVNSFDFYDNYKEEFEKQKKELLLKEAANLLINEITNRKRNKKPVFKEIGPNIYFDKIINNIIRKIEVRKENNELVSIEYIVNMIKEEIDNDNHDPILLPKKIEYSDGSSNVDLRNQSTILPPINNKGQNTEKIQFLDYDMIANVKKKKKNKQYGETDEDDEPECRDDENKIDNKRKSNMRYIRDKDRNYILEDDLDEKKNSEDFIDSIKKSGLNKSQKIYNPKNEDKAMKIDKEKGFFDSLKNENAFTKTLRCLNYITDDTSEFSQSIHLKFQKTHFNFLKRIDSFLITQSACIVDNLGQTIGDIGKTYKKKLKSLLLNKNKNNDNIENNKNINDNNEMVMKDGDIQENVCSKKQTVEEFKVQVLDDIKRWNDEFNSGNKEGIYLGNFITYIVKMIYIFVFKLNS